MNGIMIYHFDDNVVDLLYDLTSISTIPEKKKRIKLVNILIIKINKIV